MLSLVLLVIEFAVLTGGNGGVVPIFSHLFFFRLKQFDVLLCLFFIFLDLNNISNNKIYVLMLGGRVPVIASDPPP